MTMGDRWESEARRLAILDRSIESIKEALRSAYDAGRAEQREAGAKVCDEQPDRSPAATYLYAPYGTGCRDCAAAIRAQNLSGSPELDPGATGPTSADLKNWFWDGDTIVDCDGDRIWIDEDEDDPEPRPSLAIQGQNGRTICWLDIVESLLSRRSQRLGTPPAR